MPVEVKLCLFLCFVSLVKCIKRWCLDYEKYYNLLRGRESEGNRWRGSVAANNNEQAERKVLDFYFYNSAILFRKRTSWARGEIKWNLWICTYINDSHKDQSFKSIDVEDVYYKYGKGVISWVILRIFCQWGGIRNAIFILRQHF